MIAALYAVLNLIVAATPVGSLAFGPVQFRISEALTVLPAVTSAAIPGLFVGCIISNLLGMIWGWGGGVMDVVFGSLATLAAAMLSYAWRSRRALVPLPPVVINAVVVGLVLYFFLMGTEDAMPLGLIILSIAAGQAVVCYGLGLPLLAILSKRKPAVKP